MTLRLPTARLAIALLCLLAFLVVLAGPQTSRAGSDASVSMVDQQLTALDQQFDDGEYRGSPRDYLKVEAGLIDSAVARGEDLPVVDDPEPVDVEDRISARMQAQQIAAHIKQGRLDVQCAPLTVVCPFELPARIAQVGDAFSIANAFDRVIGSVNWGFTDRIDGPMTVGQLAERQLRQIGANYLGYMGAGLVVLGGAAAAEAGPALLLGGALSTGGGSTTGVGIGAMATGVSAPALAVEMPVASATGSGVLSWIGSSVASRAIYAAVASGAVGLGELGGGGVFGVMSFGQGSHALAGACLLAVVVRGCGRSNLISQDGTSDLLRQQAARHYPGLDVERVLQAFRTVRYDGRPGQRLPTLADINQALAAQQEAAQGRPPVNPPLLKAVPGVGEALRTAQTSLLRIPGSGSVPARTQVPSRSDRSRSDSEASGAESPKTELLGPAKVEWPPNNGLELNVPAAASPQLPRELLRALGSQNAALTPRVANVAKILADLNPNATPMDVAIATSRLTTPGGRAWLTQYRKTPDGLVHARPSDQLIFSSLDTPSALVRNLAERGLIESEWK